jgi:uncharacterized membrane protein
VLAAPLSLPSSLTFDLTLGPSASDKSDPCLSRAAVMPTPLQALLLRLGLAASGAALLAVRGLRRRSLSPSGAYAGFAVGFLTLLAGMREGCVLAAFFLSSSRLTRLGERDKGKIEADHRKGGQRNWVQVFANGLMGTLFAVLASADTLLSCESPLGPALPLDAGLGAHGWWHTALAGAFIGHYAACNGDTWSSEVGVLSTSPPRLITAPWRRVPPGTNGGVTPLGTAAGAAGGLLIGLTHYACTLLFGLFAAGANVSPLAQWPVVLVGLLAGLVGTLTDSLLGATLQYSGYDTRGTAAGAVHRKIVEKPTRHTKRISGIALLDNHAVNFFAALITSGVTAAVCVTWFHPGT